MAEPTTRPTPRLLAQPAPATQPARAPYERRAWEQAVFAGDLHVNDRAVALVLAHYAGTSGHLPMGGPQNVARLSHDSGVSAKGVRLALTQLEARGYITRPDSHTWSASKVRPLTLVLPSAAARTEPAHPSRAVS
jgi:hypothetical protein